MTRRQFWIIPRHPSATTQYNPVRPVALLASMTLTEPAPVGGPWPFTDNGLETMCDWVSSRYGTTASEFVGAEAAATLTRLQCERRANFL